MPKSNKPKRQPLAVRLSAEERTRLAVVGLYLNKKTLAGAARAAINFTNRAIATNNKLRRGDTIDE